MARGRQADEDDLLAKMVMWRVMLGESVKLRLDEEQEAGQRTLARGRPVEFDEEQEAGRDWAARARTRLEAEQQAGRRPWSTRAAFIVGSSS